MASKIVPTGSKRPRDPSTQGLKVKFLINIPLKVDSEDEAKKRCRYLLNALEIEGFKEEDRKFTRDRNGREVLEDVAVIFGMNGKHTQDLVKELNKLEGYTYDCKIRYSIITYTWGSGGTIATELTDEEIQKLQKKSKKPKNIIPYQDIREYLKSHAATTNLVRELRGNDRSLVYFSFIDSDTFSFNSIYSEYLEIVRKELKKDPPIPPTLMSTGYELTHEKKQHLASDLDLQIRAALAEVNGLFVYYPEPNFCVLVDEEKDTIEESFIKKGRNKGDYTMESCVLIRQVKTRANFKAVFPVSKPIIIVAPERFQKYEKEPELKDLKIRQSTLNDRTLAIGVYCNGAIEFKETYKGVDLPNDPNVQPGVYHLNLKFIRDLYNCDDDAKFEELSKKNPFSMDGGDGIEVVEAIRQARECRKVFEGLQKQFSNR